MSATDLELLLRRIVGEGVQLHPSVYLVILCVSVFSAGIGTYAGAYLRRRGENLATKADFDVLLDQLRQQTSETENVKAEIAKAGWIHQRRWDIKRELYWELLKTLEEIRQKARWLDQMLGPYGPHAEARKAIETFASHMQERGIVERLINAKGVAGIILTQSVAAAIDDLAREYNNLADVLVASPDPVDALLYHRAQFQALLTATSDTYTMVAKASREDLLEPTLS